MSDLKDPVRDYVHHVIDHTDTAAPPIGTLQAEATRRHRRRLTAAGAATAVVAVAIAGVAVTTNHGRAPAPVASGTHSTSHPATQRASTSNQHAKEPATNVRPKWKVKIGEADGARIAPYFLPTLTQFANSGVIDRVVVGTVTNVEYKVSDDGSNTVFTVMSIRTQDPLGLGSVQTITVREMGGIVPLRAVRSDFEAHTGPIPDDQLDDLVDYSDGTTHPKVGETELLFLENLPQGELAQYSSMARMNFNTNTKLFNWAGQSPNPDWASSLSQSQIVADFTPLLRIL